MPSYSLRDPAVAAFIVIPVILALVFTWGVWSAWRRTGGAAPTRAAILAALGMAAWMAVTLAAARSGVLMQWDAAPPPFMMLLAAILAVSMGVAWSPVGWRLARLPLWALVAAQAFRLPLEVAMHGMFERGIMPEQMSYSGRNFDIVTGATAIIVAIVVAARPSARRLVLAWNILGLALLANIVTVALLSTPRFALFGPDRVNIWVAYAPFVWLPAVMVASALAGHLIVFRALRGSKGLPAS